MKLLTYKLLRAVEHMYLRAHGWRLTSAGWAPPADYAFKRKHEHYEQTHAVNAQKQAYKS